MTAACAVVVAITPTPKAQTAENNLLFNMFFPFIYLLALIGQIHLKQRAGG